MKLLVLTAAYPGSVEPQRGIFIENLNRALVRVSGGDLAISVVAPRTHAEDSPAEDRHGMEVRRFRYPSGGRRLKEHARVPWWRLALYVVSGLHRTIADGRRVSPQLILCHWVLPAGVMGVLAAVALRRPCAVFAHGSDLNRYGRRGLGRRAATWCFRRAARIFAASEELARRARSEHGAEEDRIRVLPMGVGDEFTAGDRDEARGRLRLGEGPDLLFVGDLIEEKGILHLLAAVESLRESCPGARLHLVGAGPLASKLERSGPTRGEEAQLAAEGRVILHGPLPPEDLARWYRAADLLVHPSLAEGTPVTVLEALSCGLPVLASRVGGIPDVVADGRTGQLVPPGDTAALAGALRHLLADPSRLEAMRASLRADPPDHSMRRRAEILYPQLLEIAGDAL